MSACIGTVNQMINIDLGKGFSIECIFTVIPACPKKHAELFKNEAAQGNTELMSESTASSADFEETKDDGFTKIEKSESAVI